MIPEDEDIDIGATGGDIEMSQEEAETVGDEAVGGTAPTPEQDIVDDIAASLGIEIPDRKPIRVTEMLERRDDSRWELDPESAEDYKEHGI
jgi:Family of unknown function (DUF6335)